MRMKYFKLKFLMVLLALAAVIPSAWAATGTDVLTAADFSATADVYTVTTDVSKPSGAV